MADKTIKSIRGDKEVFERLADLAKAQGLDQGAALEALLNTWDVQAAKGQVPERAADVADFDSHIQGIQQAFIRSLQLAQGAEQRARTSYAAQLDGMAATVARLQAELDATKDQALEMRKKYQEAREQVEALQKRVDELEKQDRLALMLADMAQRMDTRETATARKPAKNGKEKKPTEPEVVATT